MDTPPLSLSASAARRIAELRTAEGMPAGMLRLAVAGGGCSGFQMHFSLDDNILPGDAVIERDGEKLVVDDISLPLVAGAEVDFRDDLSGRMFVLNNPNAKTSCGCGSSFAV